MVNWDLLGCRRKGKLRFSGHSQKTIYRYSAIAVYAFKGPLAEGAREPNQCFSDLCESAGSYTRAGSAVFFRRDWRRLDLGFCFDFSLTIFRIFRGCRRGLRSARKPRAKR
ncbi:hypothetical protein, partial [Cloacibacillus evryensis]